METPPAGRAARRHTGRLGIRVVAHGRVMARRVRLTARRHDPRIARHRDRVTARRARARRLRARRVVVHHTRRAAARTAALRIAAEADTRVVAGIPAVAAIRIARV